MFNLLISDTGEFTITLTVTNLEGLTDSTSIDLQFRMIGSRTIIIIPTNVAPQVQLHRPNGGELVRGTYEIQWGTYDPDGDPLTYKVSYSPNGGQTWIQLASEITKISYSWDSSMVEPGSNYLVRVEASDGVLTANDVSFAPFTVELELPPENNSESFFIPSFEIGVTLGALMALMGLVNRRNR